MPLPVVTSDDAATGTRAKSVPTNTQGQATTTMATDSDVPSLPSFTPSSTLMTSVRESELLTATPSTELPSSISWEPAITASSLPSAESNSSPGNTAQPTSGGTFILAFLIYALWRRRKGATYAEIIRFRPHSSTVILSPGQRPPDFTALPIYRESRYSVRSSKHGSMLSFSKLMQKRAPSPSSESFTRGPWLRSHWKTANPPTPTRTDHPLSQVMTAPAPPTPPLKTAEMAHVPSTAKTERIRINRIASEGDASKPWPTVSSREVPSSRETSAEDRKPPPDSPKSDTHLHDDTRWSWTNSQAPPTPRLRAQSLGRRSSKPSLGSLPRFRKVQSWVRSQSERASDRIAEEQPSKKPPPPPPPKPKLPPLKNKASKPVLAPISAKPTRRLSKKSGPPSASSRPTTAVAASKGEAEFRPKTAG